MQVRLGWGLGREKEGGEKEGGSIERHLKLWENTLPYGEILILKFTLLLTFKLKGVSSKIHIGNQKICI